MVVTIFVNPLQFGPNEDFDRYPRTLDADLEACRGRGRRRGLRAGPRRDVPGRRAAGHGSTPGRSARSSRAPAGPGTSTAMLTVVAQAAPADPAPTVAFFGEKDFQQLALIRRMVARPRPAGVEIVGVPTVREPDGLALSSRNRYLSAEQRAAALALSRALRERRRRRPDAGAARWPPPPRSSPTSRASRVDYLALTDPTARPGARRRGRPGCWSPPGSAPPG